MKLRKLYIAIGVTAASVSLLSSCAMDDIIQQYNGTEIAFRPTLGTTPSSRAAETTVASFKNREIVVTAVDQHNDYYFKDVTFHPLDPESTSPVYVSDQKYYWPGDGSPLHFTAYPKDYVTRGLLDPATNTLTYQPRSSWYADENKTFDGGTMLPDGTTILADKTVRLPKGEIVEPDGTIHFAGSVTVYPNKTIDIEYGIIMDTHRNITLYDGSIIDRQGIVTLSNGVVLTPTGGVILTDGTSLTRNDVGEYPGGITIKENGSILFSDGTEIPPLNAVWGLALPDKIYVDKTGEVNIHDFAFIGKNGDISIDDGTGTFLEGYMGETSIWLGDSYITILLGGNIYLSDGIVIPPSREVEWLTNKNTQPIHEDIVTAHATGSKADIAGLPLSFKHRLSNVEIWAINSNPNYEYEIVSVKLARVKGNGSISTEKDATWVVNNTFRETYQPDIDFNIKYATHEGPAAIRRSMSLPKNIRTSLSDPNLYYASKYEGVSGAPIGKLYGSLMVLPQTLTPWNTTFEDKTGAYLAVKLNIHVSRGPRVYPAAHEEEEYAWVAVPLSGTWDAGKRYVYTLDFTNGAGYSDPEQPNPHLVLNGPFKFTLNVTDWQEGVGDSYPIDPK